MKIHHKSPALLEAQVGSFLLDLYEGNRKGARKNLAKKTRQLLELELLFIPHRLEPTPHKHYARYLGYLASADRNLIMAEARAIERYHDVFKPAIREHYAEIADHEPLSRGGLSDAFHLRVDSTDYIVRRERSGGLSEINKHFLASLHVQDIQGLEHIEAISWQDAITVAPQLPGKTIDHLDEIELEDITPEQLSSFYKTLQQANERGVNFDGTPGNILYDKTQGFSAIDFSLMPTGSGGGADETLLCITAGLATEWTAFGNRPDSYASLLPKLHEKIEAIISPSDVPVGTLKSVGAIMNALPAKQP